MRGIQSRSLNSSGARPALPRAGCMIKLHMLANVDVGPRRNMARPTEGWRDRPGPRCCATGAGAASAQSRHRAPCGPAGWRNRRPRLVPPRWRETQGVEESGAFLAGVQRGPGARCIGHTGVEESGARPDGLALQQVREAGHLKRTCNRRATRQHILEQMRGSTSLSLASDPPPACAYITPGLRVYNLNRGAAPASRISSCGTT